MEENKFEKQVQQKMDELRIQPSDAVWKKIEVRIEKKKDRKWGLIILFLLMGLALSGGYWLWNNRQEGLSANHKSEHIVEQNSVKENKTSQPEINAVPGTENKKDNIATTLLKKKDDNKNNAKPGKNTAHLNADEKSNSRKNVLRVLSKKNEIKSNIGSNTKTEVTIVEQQSEPPADVNKQSTDSTYERVNAVSLSKPVEPSAIAKHDDTSTQKQTNIASVKKTNKNEWKLGILFSGGLSGVGNHFLSLYNAPVYSAPGALNSGPQYNFSSPKLKSAFGFLAGVFAEKSISKRSTLALGLNFMSLNTSVRLNDSGNTYTSGSAAGNYINHFNYMAIPLSIKTQIASGKSGALYWEGGLVVSELISSNALQYNEYSGYYYKNNSIFNKVQLGFNTALFVSLFPKQKTSFLVGPYSYYNASKMANEGLYNKKHFVFAGLQTQIIFSK